MDLRSSVRRTQPMDTADKTCVFPETVVYRRELRYQSPFVRLLTPSIFFPPLTCSVLQASRSDRQQSWKRRTHSTTPLGHEMSSLQGQRACWAPHCFSRSPKIPRYPRFTCLYGEAKVRFSIALQYLKAKTWKTDSGGACRSSCRHD